MEQRHSSLLANHLSFVLLRLKFSSFACSTLGICLLQVTKSLPLSSGFPGAHLAVVHTPADWGPHEVYSIADKVQHPNHRIFPLNTKCGPKLNDKVKKMNKEAGLSSFVLLVGTGLQNVHMSIEALQR